MAMLRARQRTLVLAASLLLSTQAFAGPLIINEFRVRGPNGANDEYIEIYNPGPADHTVAGGGTGYGVAASDGTTRFSIPNGTVIPAGGHYLGVNSVGYSLASYPAGNGTTGTGDATYTTNIPDNAGIALFNNNSGGASYSLANRMDAVGSTSEANALYKEGAGYPALTPFSIDYAFHRDECGKDGSITALGPCPTPGQPTDSDNNAADFVFVDTNGTSAGAGQRLGAPGPENLSSPITFGTGLTAAALDSCAGGTTPPNLVRDFTSDPANNSTFGTLDLRHTFTNNTGADLTRLRFRIVDLTTFPAPSGIADLRPRTSTAVVVTVDRPPCLSGTSNVTVQGTTLEQPPSQPNGSGFNGSLSVGTITLATPLANGASVDVRFLLGIQQTGAFKFGIVPEALPEAGLDGGMILVECTSTEQGCTPPTQDAGPLMISEFRVRGPNGANDEYIEIYNPGPADHTVASLSGSGYGVAASDGTTRFSIPNGTVIPAGGHYLGVNSVGYSLASYPAGNGTTGTGDATYTTDIPDNAGIALFNNNSGGASYSLANRKDAVGSTSEANALYKEGAGYPALTPFSIDYAFHRDECGKDGSITAFGPCPTPGQPTDSDDNAADFVFVDTNGTSAGAGQRLGAPGPENLSSPITFGTGLVGAPLDSCVAGSPPNQVRDFTSDPANNSTFGTLDLRHTFTNNTGADLTRLRFRIVDLTTFPAPSGIADLRPRTSTAVVVTVDRPPCLSGTSNVTVQGTTLEQPPSQPNGSGFNGSLSVGTVTLATPLANGASVDVRFLLGIQQTGAFKFGIVPEALPEAGLDGGMILVECNFTDGTCIPPVYGDLSIVKSDSPDPVVVGQPLTYTLLVSNAGPDDADNVMVTDSLPAGLDYQSAVTTQGSCQFAAPTVTCDLGTVASGGNATVTIVATPQSAGMVSNTATVDSDAIDPVSSDNSATSDTVVDPGETDLAITKTSSANPATIGVPFQYTLTILNHGPDNATLVEVVDALPGNLTFGSATPSQGSCAENAGVVTCQLGTIPNQGSATVVIEVTPTATGELTNTATVSSQQADPDPSDSTATVVVEVGLGFASFTVTKDFTDGNPAEVLVSISCNTGLPLEQSFHISEAGLVKFIVTEFMPGEMDCTITEEVPDGYLPEYFDGNASNPDGCIFEDIAGNAELVCQITNSPAPVDVEIEKLWVFESDGGGIDTRYELFLECSTEIVGDDVFSDDESRVFTTQVIPGYPSSVCSVEEQVFDNAVEIDNDCQEIVISAGHGASCVITNTVFFEGIPTLDRRGLAVLALLLLGLGLVGVRRLAG